MKKIRKNKLIIIALALSLITVLLYVVEHQNQDASIQHLSDAVWYVIVTLTTVGYGDYYPITKIGKMIGVIIVFGSMGLLAYILASVANLLNSELKPGIYLKKHKNDVWYVFTELNEKTYVLIQDICKEPMVNKAFICLSTKLEIESDNIVIINTSMQDVVNMKNNKEDLHLFFMKDVENDYENFAEAFEIYKDSVSNNKLPYHVYCLTEYTPETIPVNVICFNQYQNISRCYWYSYPVKNDDEKIVIIGMGKNGREILERALYGNVIKINQHIEYHIFGDSSLFVQEHGYLQNYFNINKRSGINDSIFFYDTSWCEKREVIEQATRIILCDDDRYLNLKNVSLIRKYFVTTCGLNDIHVLTNSEIDDLTTIGALDTVFTAKLVLQEKLNQLAMRMNANYVKRNGGADWYHLSEFKRQSNIAVADHLQLKVQILNASSMSEAYDSYINKSDSEKLEYWHLEHERWWRFHIVNNWKYAKDRKDAKREHDLLVPFDELSYEDQAKDEDPWITLYEYR